MAAALAPAMSSVVQHLDRCRKTHTRKTIRGLLQPELDTKLLDDLGSKVTAYRTHIYQDVATCQHLRVRDSSAQMQLLDSFVRDLKQGFCPYLAEEHTERFPMYMQLVVSGEADLVAVCRTLHAIALGWSRQGMQCYCFAAEQADIDHTSPWRGRFLRVHWPLMLVTAKAALQLRECALQAAMAIHGEANLRHVAGWESQYNTPLAMIGCGGHIHTCEGCRNAVSKRQHCDRCAGTGTQITAQPIWPVLVLRQDGTPHWEDQRKLGVTGLHSWDLRCASTTAVREMLEYISVRTLLPQCRYPALAPLPLFWAPPLPPMCAQCAVPMRGGACVQCRKPCARRLDAYRKYRRSPVPPSDPHFKVLRDIVVASGLDPYLHTLERQHPRQAEDSPAQAALQAALGLSFEMLDHEDRERRESLKAYICLCKRQHGNNPAEPQRVGLRKATQLLADMRREATRQGGQRWFRYTRVEAIEALRRREDSPVEKYLVRLGGLSSGYCPQQHLSHSEASVVEVLRDEGCRYVCGDPQCRCVYPATKTTQFLKHRRTLFGADCVNFAVMPVSRRQWLDPVARAAITSRLIEAYSGAPPPRSKKARRR